MESDKSVSSVSSEDCEECMGMAAWPTFLLSILDHLSIS